MGVLSRHSAQFCAEFFIHHTFNRILLSSAGERTRIQAEGLFKSMRVDLPV